MNTCNFFEWKSTLNLDYLTKYTHFLSLQDTITLLYKCRFTTNALFKLVQKADNKQVTTQHPYRKLLVNKA